MYDCFLKLRFLVIGGTSFIIIIIIFFSLSLSFLPLPTGVTKEGHSLRCLLLRRAVSNACSCSLVLREGRPSGVSCFFFLPRLCLSLFEPSRVLRFLVTFSLLPPPTHLCCLCVLVMVAIVGMFFQVDVFTGICMNVLISVQQPILPHDSIAK